MLPSPRQALPRRPRGFTLIELMITVAIVAVVASLAYPSFMGAVRKSRRAEAVETMTLIQQAQERWRSDHPTFTTDLTDTGLRIPGATATGVTTPHGYYQIVVTVPSGGAAGTSYTITASASGAQAADTMCSSMSMQVVGGQMRYDSTSGQSCWSK